MSGGMANGEERYDRCLRTYMGCRPGRVSCEPSNPGGGTADEARGIRVAAAGVRRLPDSRPLTRNAHTTPNPCATQDAGKKKKTRRDALDSDETVRFSRPKGAYRREEKMQMRCNDTPLFSWLEGRVCGRIQAPSNEVPATADCYQNPSRVKPPLRLQSVR